MQTLTYVVGTDKRALVSDVQNFQINWSTETTYNWVQARQYENSMRQVFVNVKNANNTPFDLTGCNIWFEGLLPDDTHKILDAKHATVIDAQNGQFRFDFPAQAFAVAGSYKQAFFRIVRDGMSVTTLEFDLEVLADKVISGVVATDYITPFEDLYSQLEEILRNADGDLQSKLSEWTQEYNAKVQELTALGTSVTNSLTSVQNRLTTIEEKISEDGLFTQAEADAFKQSIQKELNELAKFGFEESSEDSVIAQQARSLYSYAAEGLEKRNALAPNVLRVGTLNLALDGALNIGIDVGDFWSETDKASRRLTENQMAMDWMGCNIVGCQEVISSMLSGAYNSYNRAMAEDQMYPNLYVGLSPEINHQLQTLNGMREGNALFADRQMSYVALAAYSSDPNRSYLAYRTTFNAKNVLVVVTHNNVNDESEFEELTTFCAQQTFDTCIILADTNNDPDSQCIEKLLAAGFDIVSKKDDNTMITEPAYSGHQMQIFYKGCVLQKKELYDVTAFQGSDHKAIVAEFKVGD